MRKSHNKFETIIHGIFLILGLITVGFVLLITVYLVIAGIPAIREIGILKFLFGKKWASTAATPLYGILPFILTSVSELRAVTPVRNYVLSRNVTFNTMFLS